MWTGRVPAPPTSCPGTLVLAFMIPIFQLCLFGFIDQSVRDLPTVVVDQDHSAALSRHGCSTCNACRKPSRDT